MGALTEIYVDPAIAANSGSGTIGSPYGDLQHALNTATRDSTNGNRFNIKAGTAEVLTATLSFATYGTPTETAPCVFQGYTAAADDGGYGDLNGNNGDFRIFDEAKQFVIFKHLILRNTNNGQIIRGSDIQVNSCVLHTTTGYAIVIVSGSGRVVNNDIHNCGNGVFLNAAGAYVGYNWFENGANDFGECVNIVASDAVVEHNIFTVDGSTLCITNNTGQPRAVIAHNSILSNGGTGTGIVYGLPGGVIGTSIVNNLIEGFSGAGGDGIITNGDVADMCGNAVYNCTTPYVLGDQALNAHLAANETLGASPFAKSGSNTFANRFVYFAPVATGNVQGGAYGGGGVLDKGAVQHAGGGAAAPNFNIIPQSA